MHAPARQHDGEVGTHVRSMQRLLVTVKWRPMYVRTRTYELYVAARTHVAAAAALVCLHGGRLARAARTALSSGAGGQGTHSRTAGFISAFCPRCIVHGIVAKVEQTHN